MQGGMPRLLFRRAVGLRVPRRRTGVRHVLPAASLSEKEGTFTNVQGRVQKFERAFLPKPPVRAHWEHLLMLATALGYGDRNWTPSDLLRSISGEVEGYGAVKGQELEGGTLLKKGDFAWAGTL